MSDLKFKIGAAIDGSFDVVFRTIVERAKKASKTVSAEMSAGAVAFQGPYRTAGRIASEALTVVDEKGKKAGASLGVVADGAKKKMEALADGIKKIPVSLDVLTREADRAIKKMETVQARAALGLSSSGGQVSKGAFGQRVGYWSMRNFSPVTPTLQMGMNVARDIARGAGVDASFASQVHGSVERESLATQLSIQGQKSWAKADDPASKKVASSTLISEAHKVANDVFMDPNEILKAQTKFVDLTGDLETARAVMLDLGRTANATGSDMGDMATAAAAISVNLDASMGGDKQGKIEAMSHIMRVLGAQGKEGAVEIKQYAAQMSKVAAAAAAFGGTDRAEVFNMVGMMVQESRKRGGSTTATQAATSVSAFARDMTKDAKRLNASYGLDVFSDKTHRFLASPQKIIEASILQTGGSEDKLRAMFKNSMSFRAVNGFAATYNLAEQNKKGSGKEALEAEFASLRAAVITEKDVDKANKEKGETTASRAQLFNNALAEMTDKLMSQTLPALSKAGPGLLSAADKIGQFVAWAATNPWQGVSAALGVSIGKAGIEQVLRAGIENAFAGAGASRNLFAGAAIAFTIGTVGKMMIDNAFEEKTKEANDRFGEEQHANASLSALERAGKSATPEQQKAAQADADTIAGNSGAEMARHDFPGPGKWLMDTIANVVSGGETGKDSDTEHLRSLDRMNNTLERIHTALTKSGAAPRPSVDRGGRDPEFAIDDWKR